MSEKNGFTLVEILFALSIIALIFGVVAITSTTSLARIGESQRREDAVLKAQGGIELVKNFKDRNFGVTERTNTTCTPLGGCVEVPAVCVNCGRDIIAGGGLDRFHLLDGTYCVNTATRSTSTGEQAEVKYLFPVSITDVYINPFCVDDAQDGITRYMVISTVSGASRHPGESNMGERCLMNSCIRKVRSVAEWCVTGGGVPECQVNNRRSVDLNVYLYKWKESSIQ